jgi:hypothetical protein
VPVDVSVQSLVGQAVKQLQRLHEGRAGAEISVWSRKARIDPWLEALKKLESAIGPGSPLLVSTPFRAARCIRAVALVTISSSVSPIRPRSRASRKAGEPEADTPQAGQHMTTNTTDALNPSPH